METTRAFYHLVSVDFEIDVVTCTTPSNWLQSLNYVREKVKTYPFLSD